MHFPQCTTTSSMLSSLVSVYWTTTTTTVNIRGHMTGHMTGHMREECPMMLWLWAPPPDSTPPSARSKPKTKLCSGAASARSPPLRSWSSATSFYRKTRPGLDLVCIGFRPGLDLVLFWPLWPGPSPPGLSGLVGPGLGFPGPSSEPVGAGLWESRPGPDLV